MAYQNVGTPRFYINTIEGLASNGLMQIDDIFRTLPVDMSNSTIFEEEDGFRTFSSKNFIALLGHKIKSDDTYFSLADQLGNKIPLTDIINLGTPVHENEYQPEYNGFTIATFDSEFEGATVSTANNTNIGSIILGTYYQMPHSPDLNLTMTRDYSGIRTIETKGGASLSNSFYSKPPAWGSQGAWELGDGDPKLSRSGRRLWDLSFSYLDDGDVFGSNQYLRQDMWGEQTSPPYEEDDIADDTYYEHNLLTDDNFYSQVIHKTNGGQLPFIFQPDVTDNTQFAICKFDSGFKFTQVANGVYNMKLKIREVW